MESKKYKDNSSNFITCIAIIIIIIIIGYVAYALLKNNNFLNLNEFNSKTENNLSEKHLETKNDTENIIAQKEITYKETEIASYTSTLYDNQESRVYNINKACSILNGTVVKPGEEFSFNNTIGPMGEANGYKKATGFDANGKLIQISGGGMCQISSTLYNAVLLANLEVTERHPHSRRVNYVPVDKDATIYYGSLDFKFINNTSNDLKIVAENDNYSVTIKIYKIEQSNW